MRSPQARKTAILTVLSMGLFLVSMDMTVLYTALPTLVHQLGASNAQKLWIINIYPLIMAGLLPGAGSLADQVGHRRAWMGGLAIFGLASLGSAFAFSPAILILGRAGLAVGAALMMPSTLALMRQTYTTDRERAIAIGIWGSVASGAATLGPMIGGALLTRLGWGSVFLINVPVVVIAWVLTPWLIPERGGHREGPLDIRSSMLAMVGLFGLIDGLKEFVKPQSSALRTGLAFSLAFIFLGLFIRRQRRLPEPMIDLGLFRNRRFSAGVLTAILSMLAMMGIELAISQRLQLVQGHSPMMAGLVMMPLSLASFLAGPVAGSALGRLGAGPGLWGSLLLAALGLGGIALAMDQSPALQALGMVLFGFGSGSAMSVASTLLMTSVPEAKAGMAASIDAVSYEIGGALGVAILGSIMTFVYSNGLRLPEGLRHLEPARDGLDQALILAGKLDEGQAQALVQTAKDAFNHASLSVTLWTSLFLFLGSAGVGLLLRRDRPGAPRSLRGRQARS